MTALIREMGLQTQPVMCVSRVSETYDACMQELGVTTKHAECCHMLYADTDAQRLSSAKCEEHPMTVLVIEHALGSRGHSWSERAHKSMTIHIRYVK